MLGFEPTRREIAGLNVGLDRDADRRLDQISQMCRVPDVARQVSFAEDFEQDPTQNDELVNELFHVEPEPNARDGVLASDLVPNVGTSRLRVRREIAERLDQSGQVVGHGVAKLRERDRPSMQVDLHALEPASFDLGTANVDEGRELVTPRRYLCGLLRQDGR